ncbi:MAG: diacylglycerol kinase [Halanaerobiaceae bacterium]
MRFNGLSDSFNFALEGLVHTLRTLRNMKIHFSIAFIVLLGSLFFDISKTELIMIFFSISLVIAMELINTGVEVIIDMIASEYRYRAKIAKNISAAAVLMAAVNAVIIAYLVFFDDLRKFSLHFIRKIHQDPLHLIFVNFGLLIIVIMALKARKGRGTPLEGGMPSGHSAVAFSAAALIIFITRDIVVGTLAMLMALLIVQSRLQNRVHDMLEIVAGALLGILFTLIIIYFI